MNQTTTTPARRHRPRPLNLPDPVLDAFAAVLLGRLPATREERDTVSDAVDVAAAYVAARQRGQFLIWDAADRAFGPAMQQESEEQR